VKFVTSNKACIKLSTAHDDKTIEGGGARIFLGFQIDNNLNWETSLEYITLLFFVP
jgi:hypothetical protein